MVLELVLGFLFVVAASYVGTILALRGYFGRERYPPLDGTDDDDGPPGFDDAPGSDDDSSRADDVPRASDVLGSSDRSTGDAEDERA